MVIQNMVPTLLRLYVDVEFTDQHNQVGDKDITLFSTTGLFHTFV